MGEPKGDEAYTKPVVAIVNQHTVSTGDGCARSMFFRPNTRVVGMQPTSGSFGMAGGEVYVGNLEKIRLLINYPFGASVDAGGAVQLDCDASGNGGVPLTHPVPRTNDNLIRYATGAMAAECNMEAYWEGNVEGIDGYCDVEMEWAVQNLQ